MPHYRTPRIVVLGPQGAGKGTQASRLMRRLHVPHVAMGDLLRDEVARRTPLGLKIGRIMTAGRMIPDAWSSAVMRRRLRQPDARRGWIVDGYPRSLGQARAFDRFGKPNVVLHLHLADRRAITRLSGRRVCSRGHIYHLRHDPPTKRRGRCDLDGRPLTKRHDDTPAAIRRRLKMYHQQTEPVIAHYRRRGLVRRVAADVGIAQVYRRVLSARRTFPWLSSRHART